MANIITLYLLIAGAALSVYIIDEAETAQCMPDSINPCRATCNGTFFDLSKAFDFP